MSTAQRSARAQFMRRWLGIWLLLAAVVVILGGFVAQARAVKTGDQPAQGETVRVVPSPSHTPLPTPTSTPDSARQIGERLSQLETAWQHRNWEAAAALLNEFTILDPDYPGLDHAKCDTYKHWAHDSVAQGQIEQAYHMYQKASSYCNDPAIGQQRSLALRYLYARFKYDQERWSEAAVTLQKIYQVDPDYAETRTLLYTAYLASSRALLAENHLQQAQAAAQAAQKLNPDGDQAQALLEQIRPMLVPAPVPAQSNTSGKRIEVNVSKQRMYVWQGETLVHDWVCSTGGPGSNTATGHYSVLDKIPEAWASTWSLRMPYWLGIYHAGPLENGIHALPILSNGQKLWEGYLGTPVSYGCIILSTENAQTLYHWAEIGTPVWIHY